MDLMPNSEQKATNRYRGRREWTVCGTMELDSNDCSTT